MSDQAPGTLLTREDAPMSEVREAALSAVWIDRDLSWIEFNRRVLAEALDERTPLPMRARSPSR